LGDHSEVGIWYLNQQSNIYDMMLNGSPRGERDLLGMGCEFVSFRTMQIYGFIWLLNCVFSNIYDVK
jgi:hypothetical protein